MWDPFAEFTKTTLENRLDVHSSCWLNRPWEIVRIIVHAGAAQDFSGQAGMAHLLEHLIGYGGEPEGKEKMYNFFSENGGWSSLKTNSFATIFSFCGPAENFFWEKALNLAGKFIFNFPAGESLLEKERKIVNREFLNHYPLRFVLDNMTRERRIMFSGTSVECLINLIGGSPETINNISPAGLKDFHRLYYTPANISILAVGGKPGGDLLKIIGKSPFSAKIAGERTPLPQALDSLPPLAENRFAFSLGQYLDSSTKVSQGRLRICGAVPGTVSHEAMLVFNELVEEIVDREIREKRHWSYGSNSEWVDFKALHVVALQFQDLPPENLLEAERAILSALSALPESEDLFKKKKEKLLASLRLADYSGKQLSNEAMNELIANHGIKTLAEKLQLIEAVSLEDIRKIAGQLGPSRRWTLIQEP